MTEQLTRDDILAMKPGRELDRQIGEHIFGFKNILNVADYWFIDDLNTSLPSYSTDIAAAWEVAEKMSEEWPQFSIARVDTGWCVMWGFDGYGWPNVTVATAPEAIPEAICKAALLAVMEKEDSQ